MRRGTSGTSIARCSCFTLTLRGESGGCLGIGLLGPSHVPGHNRMLATRHWKPQRKPAVVEVRLRPHAPVQVFWRDGAGGRWRIPHVWRCRRIRLPTRHVLVGQGIPSDVATSRACRVVSTYYHPGSLCCWPEHYHFRDEYGD